MPLSQQCRQRGKGKGARAGFGEEANAGKRPQQAAQRKGVGLGCRSQLLDRSWPVHKQVSYAELGSNVDRLRDPVAGHHLEQDCGWWDSAVTVQYILRHAHLLNNSVFPFGNCIYVPRYTIGVPPLPHPPIDSRQRVPLGHDRARPNLPLPRHRRQPAHKPPDRTQSIRCSHNQNASRKPNKKARTISPNPSPLRKYPHSRKYPKIKKILPIPKIKVQIVPYLS